MKKNNLSKRNYLNVILKVMYRNQMNRIRRIPIMIFSPRVRFLILSHKDLTSQIRKFRGSCLYNSHPTFASSSIASSRLIIRLLSSLINYLSKCLINKWSI